MKSVLSLKLAADILTTLRFFIGLYIIRFSSFEVKDGVISASLFLWVAWVTDLLDGSIARLEPRKIQTWIGRHDLTADVTVAFGCWLFLTLSGLISPFIGFGYILLSAFLLLYFKSEHLAWGLQAPPYGMMILTALKYAPEYGALLIVWIIIVVIVTWPRFPKYTLPEFLRGMRALFK
ncbi:MAG: CDP-alcohol phosphatidyltransferase family protein [Candidatus Kryptonium sp.]|nr:CDP-alcohol phosphatidyltransferase family protein [Candidatus Kryptonium sp.]